MVEARRSGHSSCRRLSWPPAWGMAALMAICPGPARPQTTLLFPHPGEQGDAPAKAYAEQPQKCLQKDPEVVLVAASGGCQKQTLPSDSTAGYVMSV